MQEILIVDDVIANVDVLRAILTQAGYRVRVAVNGQQALQSIRVQPPTIILLDINMPVMNGLDTCSAIKKSPELTHIPIIFLSANSETSFIEKAFAAGGCDYIIKPFRSAEVLHRIKNQLDLLHSQQQALRNSALTGLLSMTSGVAHELNTPVGTAVTANSLLKEKLATLQAQITDKTLTQTGLTTSIDCLLESTTLLGSSLDKTSMLVSRFQTLFEDQKQQQKSAFQLSEALSKIKQAHQTLLAKKNVAITLDHDIEVFAPLNSYVVIFEELILNSLHHAYIAHDNDIKQISFKVKNIIKKNNNYIEVVYSDEGIGMDKESINHLFEPFFTLHRGDHFIGLSASRIFNIVQYNLRGSISVASCDIKGLVYTLCIPNPQK